MNHAYFRVDRLDLRYKRLRGMREVYIDFLPNDVDPRSRKVQVAGNGASIRCGDGKTCFCRPRQIR